MNLIKEHWDKADINEFQNYLKSFSNGKEKGEWEKRIVNTKLPCIAVPSKTIADIVKQIAKGNFLSFVDLWIWENFSNTTIIGSLICKIKDFKLMKQYLINYLNRIDNWASCDTLKFKINEENKSLFFNLSQELIASKKTFLKRAGLIILFKFVDDNSFIDKIFSALNSLTNETEYYVNMAGAWLLAECFTKQRNKTLEFLSNNQTNDFVINKGIQKCRDSFRVSDADKEMLKKFKR